MYERMLDKRAEPSMEDMAAYCGEHAQRFAQINQWLSQTYGTAQKIGFPYGKHYGWGVAHRIKSKLICHVFAEDNAFSVMVRLSDKQFESVYGRVGRAAREEIDHRYPCGDGGWIQFRVTDGEGCEDAQRLLTEKCAGK